MEHVDKNKSYNTIPNQIEHIEQFDLQNFQKIHNSNIR